MVHREDIVNKFWIKDLPEKGNTLSNFLILSRAVPEMFTEQQIHSDSC